MPLVGVPHAAVPWNADGAAAIITVLLSVYPPLPFAVPVQLMTRAWFHSRLRLVVAGVGRVANDVLPPDCAGRS